MADIAHHAVSLATTNPAVLTDVTHGTKTVPLSARLYAPFDHAAPWPAAVVCHGSGDGTASREQRYAHLLGQHGCAALFIDSFAGRRSSRWLRPWSQLVVTESVMLADAFAALRWLAARDEVDPQRIAIAGFGEGGTAAVLSAYRQIAHLFAPCGARFCCHVSYWGLTAHRLVDVTTTGAPVALLNGALDTTVNLARAKLIAGDLQLGGSAVEDLVFPDTDRCWDMDEREPRSHRRSLSKLALHIRPDHVIVDERRGAAVRGLSTRRLALACAASGSVVPGKRNEKVSAQSDQLLLRYVQDID